MPTHQSDRKFQIPTRSMVSFIINPVKRCWYKLSLWTIYGTRDRKLQFFGPVTSDNLTVKRGAATEADGEIEEVDNGDDEDSSDLIIVLQTEHGRTYCCGGPLSDPVVSCREGGHVKA